METFIAGVALALLIMLSIPNDSTSSETIARASAMCSTNGGLLEIRPAGVWYNERITCTNRAVFYDARAVGQ